MRLKRVLMTLLAALSLLTAAWGESTSWESGGAIVVNSKTLPGVTFVKQGHHLAFPVQAVVAALGKSAIVDPAAKTVTVDGQKVTATSLVMVNGVAYVGWRDLSRVVPGLEYGMEPTRAVFALGGRRTMPTASAQPAAGGGTVTVINQSAPGERIDIKPYAESGKYTVFEFFSEF